MKVEHETENATMNANITINRSNEKWNTNPTPQVETSAKLIAAAPEQVAVGLSDEQVIAWCDYIDWEENSYYAEKFKGWLKTQTFVQSVNSDLLEILR
jgi:hypothetical protein